jgi:hypothetical protein
MNKRIDLTKTDGFPFTQDMFDFMQQSYRDAIAALASAQGPLVIVTGVADLGADWGSGWVVIAGELMPFVGGTKAARVIVTETTGTEVFEDTGVETVYFTKQAVLAGAGGNLFADFVRIKTQAQVKADLDSLFTTIANKANAAQGAWTNLTLANGWAAGTHTPQYRINQFGKVEFRGSVDSSLSTTSIISTTVPNNPNITSFICADYDDNTGSFVQSNGTSLQAVNWDTAMDLELSTISYYQ